jgi:hypothetical protein
MEEIPMKAFRTLALAFTAAMLLLTLNPAARATEWEKTAVITFPYTVQVPGAVLGTGTYVFKLNESPSNRNMVMIYDQNQQRLVTSVLAVPAFRLDMNNNDIIRFSERPAGQPPAVAEWFYPGDNYGQQFVYTNYQPRQVAQLTPTEQSTSQDMTTTPSQDTSTPAATSQPTTPSDASQTTAPQTDTTPAATPDTSNTQTDTTTPAPAAPAAPADNTNSNATTTSTDTAQLPKTASPLPLVGLMGLLFAAAAFGLRRKARA